VSVVGTMQESLERALHRARLADDREVMGRVRTDGHRLVFLLNGVVRGSRLYTADNAGLDGPAREAAKVLRSLVKLLGSVHVACVEEHLYVNDVRLRVQPHEQATLDAFIAELRRHHSGGLSFHAALPVEGVKALARHLSGPATEGAEPRSALAQSLRGLPVQVRGLFRFRLRGEAPAPGAPSPRADWRAAKRGATGGQLANAIPARRAVIDIVEALRRGASSGVAPAPERTIGDRHLLAVTHLALRLGLALGLDDAALSDLGVAAMFHDVGYARGAGKDDHAAAGLRALIRQRGFHEGKIRRLRATLEHHQALRPGLSLFARILKIADDYDVLTAPRADGHPTLPPAMAQGAMWAARGSVYDPDLLALFAQMLGAYPRGTLLELSDGRWAVVVSGGRDRERFVWPVVRIVRDAEGREAGPVDEDLYLRRDQVRPRRVLNPATVGGDARSLMDRALGDAG
jgi:hypothetical protein